MARHRSLPGSLPFLLCAALLAPGQSPAQSSVPDPLAPSGRWELREAGEAPLPPMGWNSWNAFHTRIDEASLMGAAEAIVHTGLREAGYRYINIDDGWWQKRRASDGRMVIRTSIFPSARGPAPDETSFRPLTDRLHALGLKAGIYSDIGRNACSQGYPQPDSLLPTGSVAEREVGLYGHVEQDLALYFNEWGFDYIKVDGCGLNAFSEDRPAVREGQFRAFPAIVVSDEVGRTDVPEVQRLYGQVRDALLTLRPARDFVYSICNWGTANVRAWGRDYGNLWRTSDDIEPRWSSMLHNFDSVATRELYSGPGHWNDPDMLFVGHGEFDAHHLTEARTHFSLWAIEDAPLIIGYDLRGAPRSLLDIWGAREVVAVNQDPAGNQGVIAYASDDFQIIVKQLAQRNEKAVVLFNRGLLPVLAQLTAAHLKFAADAPIQVRDLWQRRDLPAFTGERTFRLEPRQSLMLRVRGRPERPDGMYLSEMPARIYVAADGVPAPQADPTLHRPVSLWDGTTRGTGTRAALAGWGGPRADSTPYDQELSVHGHRYRSGIGVLAGSRLQVRPAPGFSRFRAEVGLDDSSLERTARVRFEVYGDGRLLGQSPELGPDATPFELQADISGVQLLELVTRAIGTPRLPMPVSWGAASLDVN